MNFFMQNPRTFQATNLKRLLFRFRLLPRIKGVNLISGVPDRQDYIPFHIDIYTTMLILNSCKE